jgi:DHA1 family tetracycline resistance protein-like MFS transporter
MNIQTNTSSLKDETKKKVHWWGRWIEPWYVIYGLQGASIAGLAPILLPLVISQTGGAAQIGLVMAIFNLGGLSAPFWGYLADQRRLHRFLLISGLFITTVGLIFFPFASSLAIWVGLALLQGIGAAAASTIANLFIVEKHPSAEWDMRIGWLQSFYGGGQVIGLLLAGWLGQISFSAGLLLAGLFTLLGAFAGPIITHIPVIQPQERPVLLHPSRHGEWPVGSPQRLYHHIKRSSLQKLSIAFSSQNGIFLVLWLISFGGTAALFALYPVLMEKIFNIQPALSSVGYAIAAGLGLAFYSTAGRWARQLGAGRVLQTGLVFRIIAFFLLLGLSFAHIGLGWAALLPFLLIVIAWSLLSVSGTSLAAQLSPVGEGEGLGIFNGVTALAGVLGSVLGGWIASNLGYQSVLYFGLIGVLIGFALTFILRTGNKASLADATSGN